MGKIHVMDHPLIAHKISYIRRADVGTKEFREVINEIAQLMCYEATRDLKLKDVKIRTPIAETVGKELAGRKPAIIPILRAGVGMVDGMLSLMPAAKVGHIGFTGIRRHWNRWNITANSRQTVKRGTCLWWIRCLLPEAPVQQRSVCSRKKA